MHGTSKGRKVIRSDGIEFYSLHSAAKESNCRYQHIWEVCNGRGKTVGGYGWEYSTQNKL